MTLAEAYPKCTFHGYDIAQRSLHAAACRRVTVLTWGSCARFRTSPGCDDYEVLLKEGPADEALCPLARQQEKGLGHVKMSWLNPGVTGGGLPDVPTYNLMLTVDAVHDMARPDQVLPIIRKVWRDP